MPLPLPPNPALAPDGSLQRTLEAATLALGRLDAISTLLPDDAIFLYAYVRKEAVLSFQIEGTLSTLSDLLLFELEEAPGVPVEDVVEVSNYVTALNHGLRRLEEGFPLCKANSAALRTGSAARDPATPNSCHRPTQSCPIA